MHMLTKCFIKKLDQQLIKVLINLQSLHLHLPTRSKVDKKTIMIKDIIMISTVITHLLLRSRMNRCISCFLGSSSCQVALVLLALQEASCQWQFYPRSCFLACLSVSQVGGLVVVQSQAELALVGSQVVAHEVGVLRDKC